MLKTMIFGVLLTVAWQEYLGVKETAKTPEQETRAPEIDDQPGGKSLLDTAAPFLDRDEVAEIKKELRELDLEIFLALREAHATLVMRDWKNFRATFGRFLDVVRRKGKIEQYLRDVIKQRGKYAFRKVANPESEAKALLDEENLFEEASRFLGASEKKKIYLRLQELEEMKFLSCVSATNAVHREDWGRFFEHLLVQSELKREKLIIYGYLRKVITSHQKPRSP